MTWCMYFVIVDLQPISRESANNRDLKPIFHLETLFAQREAKTKTPQRQRDWLKLVSEKIRREQVGTVPTLFSVRTNKSPSGK